MNLTEKEKKLFKSPVPPNLWTDADLKKLIEGLKAFGYDWEKIASHIGTKSAKQVQKRCY